MQLRKRLLSLFLLTAILLPCLCITPLSLASAEPGGTSEVRYTKKIVSVLYDNSGSMSNTKNPDTKKYEGDNRQYYAEYSMRMLMALLGTNDELYITPISNGQGGALSNQVSSKENTIEVNLKTDNRQAEIERVMTEQYSVFRPSGSTPGMSLAAAVEALTSRGLMDKENQAYADDGVEHWLIIMTDGVMDTGKNALGEEISNNLAAKEKTEKIIDKYIANFPSLKTVYMTFGAGVDLQVSDLKTTYSFTAYKAADATEVTQVMQDIANQISGRYPYPSADYTVNGNKVTINLDKAKCTLKSISVVAQNCGVELQEVKYGNQLLSPSLPCVIVPSDTGTSATATKFDFTKGEPLDNGYTAKIEGTPYFSEGKLVLTFSAPVAKEQLSILAEPALEIRPYFEHENNGRWERVTAQFVNENLTVDSKLRVGYEVYELANGTLITNIDDIFGNHTASVTYAQKTYEVGETLKLQVGINPVTISVSLMDGAYKMYASVLCAIEKDPSAYKIDAEYNTMVSHKEESTKPTYTIFIDGSEVKKKSTLDGYALSVKVTDPRGATKDVTATVDADGKIRPEIVPTKGLYGDYTVKFKIISPDGFSREHTYQFTYTSLALTIKKEGSNPAAGATQASVSFWALLVDTKLDKNQLAEFDWSVSATAPNGKSLTVTPTVDNDGTVRCTLDMTKGLYGVYTVNFTVKRDGEERSEAHTVAFTPASFELKADHIDAMPAGQTKTTFTYTVKMNGTPLSKEQVEQYAYSFRLTDPLGNEVACTPTVDESGNIVVPIDVAETGYGTYQAYFVFTVYEGYSRDDTHDLKNYPESLAIVPVGGSSFSMSEHQFTSGTKPIEFNLLLNGSPAPFSTRGVRYKLTAGGKDVTADATVDGNKLIYLPKSEDFGFGSLLGEKQIMLSVDFDGVPALSRVETVTITITDTTYLVEVVPSDKYDVDRFGLSETDAVLYFRVMRDGMPLSAEELRAALNSGEIKVTDHTGAFSWQLWLPTGQNIEPITRGTETLLAVSAKRDWIRPLDSFAAMLIFNGDKPISVSYGGASATDSFRFAPSPAWEYIWRVLVILLVIHIILYVIGFFNGKCKSLPTGYFLSFTLTGADSAKCEPTKKPINTSFWEKYSWHIWRFFPHKKTLWYHQPPRKMPGGELELMIDHNGKTVFLFKKANPVGSQWYSYVLGAGDENGAAMVGDLTMALKRGRKTATIDKSFTKLMANKTFTKDEGGDPIELADAPGKKTKKDAKKKDKKKSKKMKGTKAAIACYYGKVRKTGTVTTVVTFVKRNK